MPKLEPELKAELIELGIVANGLKGGVPFVFERSTIGSKLYWVQSDLGNCKTYSFQSISDAVKVLKEFRKNWPLEEKIYFTHLTHLFHRRGELIAENFRKSKSIAIKFPPSGESEFGRHIAYSLLDANTLLIADELYSGNPSGEWNFQEDRISPPSRAYLKLWEVFSRMNQLPHSNDQAIDLGSCPGGWTWVLKSFCKNVFSVDGAPIEHSLLQDPKVSFIKKDAFLLDPKDFPNLSWVCSDMICDPEKLLALAHSWIAVLPQAHFIFTLKFKGSADREVIDAFASIPHSKVIHLFQNKHELTWIRFGRSLLK